MNDKADRETTRPEPGTAEPGTASPAGKEPKPHTGKDADDAKAAKKKSDAARKMREMFKG
ncbi:hypothetical protein [Actinomadura rubrisoli]|uniref:Uncharacterized protein n=1 Tax=Actinomadura rubrisoli TaxID=2530368 RepID=A0A4V2YR45_9ACTN|nr:hypothetical protein [Actinomadura rubrisoli]TDD64737.1 hypothetical protein E1298_42060 [Actinomadura rubrisoli]